MFVMPIQSIIMDFLEILFTAFLKLTQFLFIAVATYYVTFMIKVYIFCLIYFDWTPPPSFSTPLLYFNPPPVYPLPNYPPSQFSLPLPLPASLPQPPFVPPEGGIYW